MKYNGRLCRRFVALGTCSSLAVLFAMTPARVAAQDAATLAELERQIALLSQQVAELKAAQAAQAQRIETVAAAPAPAPAQAPAQAPVRQAGAAAELSPDQLPLQTIRTPPNPGIAGQPFFAEQPKGRTTGVMATGNDRVRLTFSGQINRAVNLVDDGLDRTALHVDNENASSRFRFLGQTSPMNETQAVSLFEFEWPTNGSLSVNQIDQNVNNDINLRLLEVGFANNAWGSVFIGQGWMASDGTSEIDISGITTSGWSGQTFGIGGSLLTSDDSDYGYVSRNAGAEPDHADYATEADYQAARDTYAANSRNFVSIFSLGNNLDGLSRQKRVRYNTPIYGGFQASASAAVDEMYDFALRYGGNTSWARFAAAASYWTNSKSAREGGFEGYSASASLMLTEGITEGLSFTLSAATQDFKDSVRDDPTTWFGKIGYVQDYWDMGRTGFALMYGNYDQFRTHNEEMDLYTLAFSQNIDALGVELYMGYTLSEIDNPTIDYNDTNVFQIGTMVRF